MILTLAILAQIIFSGPRMSPEEAAAILRESPGLSNRTNAPLPADGPTVVIIGSSPTAGPFGEFAPFPPSRRLDGTLLSQRPWTMRGWLPRDRDRGQFRAGLFESWRDRELVASLDRPGSVRNHHHRR